MGRQDKVGKNADGNRMSRKDACDESAQGHLITSTHACGVIGRAFEHDAGPAYSQGWYGYLATTINNGVLPGRPRPGRALFQGLLEHLRAPTPPSECATITAQPYQRALSISQQGVCERAPAP